MDDELLKKYLLKKYLEYAKSEESRAVLFVKKHLAQAKGHWIDIVDCQPYEMYSAELLHFRFVLGGLYKRKIQPQYPSKSIYTDEREYYLMVRAITWETAHRDIEQQKSKNIASRKFKIIGIRYAKNKSKSKKRSPKYVMIHYNHE
ncbi:hypothetical protein NG795_21715 [Laspinema sp. D3]|nr:hypothetical protein [Laspinema sp. D2c]